MAMLTQFQCACCDPPRQLYFRANHQREDAYHEEDHTPAVAAEQPERFRAEQARRRKLS
jgi:hypothetical protein